MKVAIAIIKAHLFCLKYLLRFPPKGYQVQKFCRGFHGPVLRVEVVDGDSVVKVFYSRPDYTDSERREFEEAMEFIKSQIRNEP